MKKCPFISETYIVVFPEAREGFVEQGGDDILGAGFLPCELAMGAGSTQEVVVYVVGDITSFSLLGDEHSGDGSQVNGVRFGMDIVSFSGDIEGTDDLDVIAHRLQTPGKILVIVAGSLQP